MVIAVGLSSYNVGLFHLVNHAFYKALLFLGAGKITLPAIHSVNCWKILYLNFIGQSAGKPCINYTRNLQRPNAENYVN